MIDLHTHSILSDGMLLPSELVRHYEVKGVKAIAITDHIDASNAVSVVQKIVRVCGQLNGVTSIKVIPGVELTHLPLEHFEELTAYARENGIKIVVAHGETIAEPVLKGTNRKALESGVDILAHPGIISKEDALLAAEKGIFLEITARKGHSLTNGYVVKMAKEAKASLVFNTDSHSPCDMVSQEEAERILEGAGLVTSEIEAVFRNSEELVRKIG